MFWFWSIYGGIVGLLMLLAAVDAYFGFKTLPDLNGVAFGVWPSAPHPHITVVVPARNEEQAIESCLRSLAAQDYDSLDVVAVDDRSTDATGVIMDGVAAQSDGRIRVVHVSELPPGWLGKTHAMWRGGQQSSGEWLLFTDGDVRFRSDILRRCVAYAEQIKADHLVVFPTMDFHSAGERMMAANFRMGGSIARPWKAHDPESFAVIGVGAFNMVRRSAYERAGTYESMRLSVIDDLEMGKAMKRIGSGNHVALTHGAVRIHWAAGIAGFVRTLTKNAYALFGFRWYVALPVVLANLGAHVVPFVAVFFVPGWAKLGFAIYLASNLWMYFILRRAFDISPWYFFLHPVGAILTSYAILHSMYVTIRAGGVVWRGTTYSYAYLRRERKRTDSSAQMPTQ